MQKRSYDFYFSLIKFKFFESDTNSILLIKGRWGSGKTFLIKNILSTLDNKPVYVSLTGIQNIETLKRKIFLTKKSQMLGANISQVLDDSSTPAKIVGKLGEVFTEQNPYGIADFIAIGSDIAIEKSINSLVIVLDDLERMDFDKLSLEEFLGYIFELKSEKNCKVLILCNEFKIIEKSMNFSLYKEKFIDFEIEYNVNKNDIFKNILEPEDGIDLMIFNIFEKIECSNFRLVIKVKEIIRNLIHDRYDGLLYDENKIKRSIEEIFFIMAIIYLSYYRAEEFFPLDILKDDDTYYKIKYNPDSLSDFSNEVIDYHKNLRLIAPYWTWNSDCDVILKYIQEGCFVDQDIDLLLRNRMTNDIALNDKFDLQDALIKFTSKFQSYNKDLDDLNRIIFEYFDGKKIKKNYPQSIKLLIEALQETKIKQYILLSEEIENAFFEIFVNHKNINEIFEIKESELPSSLRTRFKEKINTILPDNIDELIAFYDEKLDPIDFYNFPSLVSIFIEVIIEKIEKTSAEVFAEFLNNKDLFFMMTYLIKDSWSKLEGVMRDKIIFYLSSRENNEFDEFKIRKLFPKILNNIKPTKNLTEDGQ